MARLFLVPTDMDTVEKLDHYIRRVVKSVIADEYRGRNQHPHAAPEDIEENKAQRMQEEKMDIAVFAGRLEELEAKVLELRLKDYTQEAIRATLGFETYAAIFSRLMNGTSRRFFESFFARKPAHPRFFRS